MRRGPWHQFGDRSQKLALEQLQQGVGVGVVLSPRDLQVQNATTYAQQYHALGAHVLIDQQFYNPDFTNTNLNSYPINQYRTSVSQLHQITDVDLQSLANHLLANHTEISADGVIAPAVVYEAGSDQIVELNAKLFNAAKTVGDVLNLPTYATVVLGRSVALNPQALTSVLSSVTALDSAGWYYAFEFGNERIPSSHDEIFRFCSAGLTLACTGKPVFHAYAGPTSLLSLGFGATAVGIGHSQTLWKFNSNHWVPSTGQGGGGDAAARFFSRSLWGTIICPDETALLPLALSTQILTASPFSSQVQANPGFQLPRWEANKHLVSVISTTIADMATTSNARLNLNFARQTLEGAVALHAAISTSGLMVKNNANSYQSGWVTACNSLLQTRVDDFDYLELLME